MPASDLESLETAQVVGACTEGAVEAAEALSRALDGAFAIGEPAAGEYSAAAPPADLAGPGLLALVTSAHGGVAIAVPASSGLLPDWYAAPDATGRSKLGTLGQELGMLLLPADVPQDNWTVRAVPSLAAALAAGELAASARLVTLPLTSGEASGQASILWPLANPTAALPTTAAESAPPTAAAPSVRQPASDLSLAKLPHYSRSLLKIRIPVSVHLAAKKESVQEIVELVPGSIIKFEKGCDELLQMVVGGQTIAEGEAVKVGDKFGFRITGMVMPREHFLPVKKPRNAG